MTKFPIKSPKWDFAILAIHKDDLQRFLSVSASKDDDSRLLKTSKSPLLAWETCILWEETENCATRQCARTQNTFHSIPYDLGMILGFYRPQKDLSWAEKQAI